MLLFIVITMENIKQILENDFKKVCSQMETDGILAISSDELYEKYICEFTEKGDKKVNKGTGAGGSNTNKNGLPYEDMTDLIDRYAILKDYINGAKLIKFKDSDEEFIVTKKASFFKYTRQHNIFKEGIEPAHGCKQPDECFITNSRKVIFILEKKFQNKGGSVCEKIGTSDLKIWQYSRLFPNYKIVYIYCLSDWFKNNCKGELEYLTYKKVPVFWGNDINYKDKITQFILNDS